MSGCVAPLPRGTLGAGVLAAANALVVIAAASPAARADVVGPPATDCAEGSRGATCHGGPYCRARGCLSDGDCEIGERCAARDLCTYTFDCYWAEVGAISGACSPAAPCAAGSTCTSLFVCAPAGTSRPDSGVRDAGGRLDAPAGAMDAGDGRVRTSYCGCAVPSRRPAPRWLALGVVALALAVAARRPRRGEISPRAPAPARAPRRESAGGPDARAAAGTPARWSRPD